jgi:hypothetical protein
MLKMSDKLTHIDLKDREPFKTSDEFFDWYVPVIKSFVPALKAYVLAGRHNSIVKRIPKLSAEQRDYMFAKIREISPVPSNVFLVYSPSMQTWACTFNRQKKRLELIVPTYAYYQLMYPPIIIAGVQHEMGHILNKDLMVQLSGYANSVNICMDCRINSQINEDYLMDLYDGVYYFRMKSFTPIIPKFFYPQIGLPYIEGGADYSWKTLHDYYIYNETQKPQNKKKEEPESYVKDPEVGDIVQVRKGDKEGSYGRVVDIVDGKSVIEEMTEEQVSDYFNAILESQLEAKERLDNK